MTPARLNLTVYQGATFAQQIVWKINGEIVNITGYTAKMQVRTNPSDSTVQVELSTANGRIVIDGTAGEITLTLSATVTNGLTPGEYVYDLELTDATGVVTRIMQGGFVVIAQVTQ